MNDDRQSALSRARDDAYGRLAKAITGGTRLMTLEEMLAIGAFGRAVTAEILARPAPEGVEEGACGALCGWGAACVTQGTCEVAIPHTRHSHGYGKAIDNPLGTLTATHEWPVESRGVEEAAAPHRKDSE